MKNTRYLQVILGVMVLALLACTMSTVNSSSSPAQPQLPAQAAAPVVGNGQNYMNQAMPFVENGMIRGTPSEVLAAIETGRLNGTYPGYHGSSAFLFYSSAVLQETGYAPEMVQATTGQILSWGKMEAGNVCITCFTRHVTEPSMTGYVARNVEHANNLWWALDRLDGAPAGSGPFTASVYATTVVTSRSFSPSIAETKIAELTAKIGQMQGLTDETSVLARGTLEKQLAFESERLAFWQKIQALPPARVAEINAALKTPIVIETQLSPAEITRKSFALGAGPGTRLKADTLPFSRITRIYVPASADPSVVATIRAAVPQAELVLTGAIEESASIWAKFPAQAYNLMFRGTAFLERTATTYLPMLGVFAIIYTPAAVNIVDWNETMADYAAASQSGLTNMMPEEWYESQNDWVNDLYGTGIDPMSGHGLYWPLFDLFGIDPSKVNHGGWSATNWIPIGQVGNIPMRILPGTVASREVEGEIFLDFEVLPTELDPVLVSYDSWQGIPQVTMIWPGGPAPFITDLHHPWGQGSVFYAGCETHEGIGVLNKTFAIRWIAKPDLSAITILSKPLFYLSNTCDMPQ